MFVCLTLILLAEVISKTSQKVLEQESANCFGSLGLKRNANELKK